MEMADFRVGLTQYSVNSRRLPGCLNRSRRDAAHRHRNFSHGGCWTAHFLNGAVRVSEKGDYLMSTNVKIEVDERTAETLQARAAELGVTVSELVAELAALD